MNNSQNSRYQLPLFMSGDQFDVEFDTELLEESSKPKLEAPSMFNVVMFNDDFTPMEFVVEVLETFFNHDNELTICL